MAEQSVEELPYRPRHSIGVVEVPEGIKVPQNDEEVVAIAKHIYESRPSTPQKLPLEYVDLEEFFRKQYDSSPFVDVEPFQLDLLYQQYAVKKDEELGRSWFNTFGLYITSYLEGLETYDWDSDMYLESRSNSPFKDKNPRALLMGCSSLSSAKEFSDFVGGLRPDAEVLVADIDPVAVKIAALSGAKVIQADAQRIPTETGSIDFIATNWLVISLRDRLGSSEGTIVEVMNELGRTLKQDSGRLVMVERLTDTDLDWMDFYAARAGLERADDNRDAKSTGAARILDRRKVKNVLRAISQQLRDYPQSRISENFRFKGQRLKNVKFLVFKNRFPPGTKREVSWVGKGPPPFMKN